MNQAPRALFISSPPPPPHHILQVPILGNRIVSTAVCRLNLGGKALTNILKEKVSLRSWNMMDEFYVLDDIKERSLRAQSGST